MRYQTPESQYMSRNFSFHHPVMDSIKESLQKDSLDGMSVSPVEARMLQFFVKSFGVRSIVEIGTLYGYSAVAMGLVLPADGKLFCFEKEEERAELAKNNLKRSELKCSYEVFSGPALEGLKKIEPQGPFDLVFIDANKNDYGNYLDWAEKHTKKGSLIVGDNTFLFGALWGGSRDGKISDKQIQTMNDFNKRLGDSSRYNSIMIPTVEGMTVAQRI